MSYEKEYGDYLADGFVFIGTTLWWVLTRIIFSPIALLGWLTDET